MHRSEHADRPPVDPSAPPPLTPLAATTLTVAQVAELLGISRQHVRMMARRGQFVPAKKIPGLGIRFNREAVNAWLAKTSQASG